MLAEELTSEQVFNFRWILFDYGQTNQDEKTKIK